MSEIDHLGIAVKSLAQAKKFYEQLGLKPMPEETVEAEQVRLSMVPVGESRIELLEPLSPESPIGKFLAKRGEGLHHVALHVDDLSGTVERLKASGTRLSPTRSRWEPAGICMFSCIPRARAECCWNWWKIRLKAFDVLIVAKPDPSQPEGRSGRQK